MSQERLEKVLNNILGWVAEHDDEFVKCALDASGMINDELIEYDFEDYVTTEKEEINIDNLLFDEISEVVKKRIPYYKNLGKEITKEDKQMLYHINKFLDGIILFKNLDQVKYPESGVDDLEKIIEQKTKHIEDINKAWSSICFHLRYIVTNGGITTILGRYC